MKDLNRNYRENPLKRGQLPDLEDFKYLVFDQGLSNSEMAEIFNCSKDKIRTCFKVYNIKRPQELKNSVRVRTTQLKYGVDNVSQLREIKDKIKRICFDKYGVYNVAQTKEVQDKRKQTNLQKFGVDNPAKLPEITKKAKQTSMEKFGVDNAMKDQDIKNKQKNTMVQKYGVENARHSQEPNDKIKQTCINLYGNTSVFGSTYFKNKTKETCLKKYGVENIMQTKEIRQHFKDIAPHVQEKCYKTKKKNNSFNTSEPEARIYKKLCELPYTIIRQYREKRYPFNCDFYIPEMDLFIEFQGNWTHGNHPYNPNSPEDQQELEFMKMEALESNYYKNAINTWTVRDVKKRQTAKDNNLNWIEFFTYEEFLEWYEGLCEII